MSLELIQLFVLIIPPILYIGLALWIRPSWKMIGVSFVAGLVMGCLNYNGRHSRLLSKLVALPVHLGKPCPTDVLPGDSDILRCWDHGTGGLVGAETLRDAWRGDPANRFPIVGHPARFRWICSHEPNRDDDRLGKRVRAGLG